MKKLILILAILAVASPAFAVLDVNLVKLAGNNVQIRYTGADPCNLPRGFALVIDVNGAKADVNGLGGYKTGVSTSTNRGFGIYPATIAIEPNGNVTSYGNPIADACDPLPVGADQILPSKKLVLEFGSLYAPVHDGANSPATDGNLCTLTIDCNGATGDVNIIMTGENSYRIGGAANSGIVLEDGTIVTVNKTLKYTCAAADCYIGTPALYAVWVDFNKPDCWCYKRNCRGDADGLKQLTLYWVYSNDLAILKAGYSKTDAQLKTIVSNGKPGICADFCRDKQLTLYRVYSNDLARLKAYYGKAEGLVPICDANLVNYWKN